MAPSLCIEWGLLCFGKTRGQTKKIGSLEATDERLLQGGKMVLTFTAPERCPRCALSICRLWKAGCIFCRCTVPAGGHHCDGAEQAAVAGELDRQALILIVVAVGQIRVFARS